MKLYMIRHGQSEDNVAVRHSGWAPAPLTEKGEDDARHAGELLAGISFDKVFSSDTLRARQTCGIALPGAEVEYTMLLRETNVGSLTGITVAECRDRYGEVYNKNRKERNFRDYGGEDLAMHMERIRTFMNRVESGSWNTAAAFSHGGSIHCMLDIVMGAVQDKKDYPCSNGSVSIFAFENGRWTLEEWNKL